MDCVVQKTNHLEGTVSAPPSKAYTHRMVTAALLSKGTSLIFDPLISDDTQATLEAVKAFGAETEFVENCLTIHGPETLKAPINHINCRGSGSTLRFMIPVAALAPTNSTFLFNASFERRPIAPLLDSLRELGVESTIQQESFSAVQVCGGGIRGGETSIRGDISSQFISGLLFACPKADENTRIKVTTPLESRGYVEMTMEVLIKHGIEGLAAPEFSYLDIPSNQVYQACNHVVPGDFSSAAFLLAAASVISSRIVVNNLRCKTIQSDRAIVEILKEMKAIVTIKNDSVVIQGGQQLAAVEVDAKDIPDLVPVCAVLACYANGTTEISNVKRLRYKESNRLESIGTELKKMGADIVLEEDSLVIKGSSRLHGAVINPHNDHRIAMACAVAALGAGGKTKIKNVECINKSYPQFLDDLRMLGANIIGS